MGNIVEDLIKGWAKTLEEAVPLEKRVRDLANERKESNEEGNKLANKCDELLEKLLPILMDIQAQKGYTAELVIEATNIVGELDSLVNNMKIYVKSAAAD